RPPWPPTPDAPAPPTPDAPAPPAPAPGCPAAPAGDPAEPPVTGETESVCWPSSPQATRSVVIKRSPRRHERFVMPA
ncbi:MAG: hypothetical protein EOO75_09585, partial [Myxococcales bacterium]